MKGFPFDQLEAAGGEAYGYLFENPATGTPRAIYWSFSVAFAPVPYGNSTFETSATCDWLTWPLRSWRELAGQSISTSSRLVEPETSFYFEEHNLADDATLDIVGVKAANFDIRLALTADVEGLDGEIYAGAQIKASGTVPFNGIFMVPDDLTLKPSSPAEATRLLSDFIDVTELYPPEWDRFRFAFRPRPA